MPYRTIIYDFIVFKFFLLTVSTSKSVYKLSYPSRESEASYIFLNILLIGLINSKQCKQEIDNKIIIISENIFIFFILIMIYLKHSEQCLVLGLIRIALAFARKKLNKEI